VGTQVHRYRAGSAKLEDELSAGLLSALALPAIRPPYHPKSEALNLYIRGLQKIRTTKPDFEQALDQFPRRRSWILISRLPRFRGRVFTLYKRIMASWILQWDCLRRKRLCGSL